MSEPNRPIDDGDPGAEEGTELQFDEAEPTSPTPTGATCAGASGRSRMPTTRSMERSSAPRAASRFKRRSAAGLALAG